MLSRERYEDVREAVTASGLSFIAAIRPVSVDHLLAEDKNRGTKKYGKVHESPRMRGFVPPAVEIACDPAHLALPNSNNLSLVRQFLLAEEWQQEVRHRLPSSLRSWVRVTLHDSSTYAQVEDAYEKATGALLLENFYARTPIGTGRERVAHIGRNGPSLPRFILDEYADQGRGNVFAVPMAVLPQISK